MKLDHWPYIVIILLLTILLLKDCGEKDSGLSGTSDTVRTETVSRYDTVIHEILTHKIYYFDSVKVQSEPISDTIQLIQDYFTRYTFSDSMVTDSIEATYSADIWKNSLFNPSFHIRYKFPTAVNNNTILVPKKVHVHAGIYVPIEYGYGVDLGAQVTLQDKRGRMWSLGYATDKRATIGLQWKIK